jgi:hypothetical protein
LLIGKISWGTGKYPTPLKRGRVFSPFTSKISPRKNYPVRDLPDPPSCAIWRDRAYAHARAREGESFGFHWQKIHVFMVFSPLPKNSCTHDGMFMCFVDDRLPVYRHNTYCRHIHPKHIWNTYTVRIPRVYMNVGRSENVNRCKQLT